MKHTTRLWRGKAALMAALLLTASGCTVQGIGEKWPAAYAEQRLLTGVYVFDGSKAKYRDADASSIDQMFYAFALIRHEQVSVAHWKNFKKFQAFIRKHPHITPILSVGGWGADGFSQAAATPQSRAAFAANVLDVMQQYGFLGVDIDWEYPGSSVGGIQSSPDDRENYTLLLQALRAGLDALVAADGVPRRLCVALSGSPDMAAGIDCVAVGQTVDQVNLMTYDLQQPGMASHHTALHASNPRAISATACVAAYLAAGIPASKLMLGVAFYGHRWATEADAPLYQPATPKGTLTYAAIAKLIRKTPDALHYDAVAQAPYYLHRQIFISFDDERSISQKRLYAQQQALMGMFAWEYGDLADGTLVAAMAGADQDLP